MKKQYIKPEVIVSYISNTQILCASPMEQIPEEVEVSSEEANDKYWVL